MAASRQDCKEKRPLERKAQLHEASVETHHAHAEDAADGSDVVRRVAGAQPAQQETDAGDPHRCIAEHHYGERRDLIDLRWQHHATQLVRSVDQPQHTDDDERDADHDAAELACGYTRHECVTMNATPITTQPSWLACRA